MTDRADRAADAPGFDVCVVGLGPTGLVMSHLLAERGLTVLALEREPEFYGMARAVYTDDECLRILQRAGVADELVEQMLVDRPVRWVDGSGWVLAVAHDRRRPHGWPASNFLYQPSFETTLERRLSERGSVTVRRGRSVTRVDDDDVVVVITHSATNGGGYGSREATLVPDSAEAVTARYVVACDGGRSPIREALGIGMTGTKFPQRWLVVDLSAAEGCEPFTGVPHFDFVCDRDLPTVICPQPGNRQRFEFLLRDTDDPDEFASDPSLRRMLSRWVDPDHVVVDRRLVYTFNALIASRWRSGRVFLAGDAAHMTPQFIGQGMNAGIRDADNLSWKLAEAILAGADDELLDSYESERAPHARAMTRLSVVSKDIVSSPNPLIRWAVAHLIPVASRLPVARTALRETWMKPRPRFRRGAYVGGPRTMRLPYGRRLRGMPHMRGMPSVWGPVGTLFPQPSACAVETTGDGRAATGRLDTVVGSGWSLVGVGVDPRTVPVPPELAHRGPALARVSPDSEELRGFPVREGDVVVLRPDGFVYSVLRAGA